MTWVVRMKFDEATLAGCFVLKAVDRLPWHDKAFACMNDDVESDDDAVAVEDIMHEWQESRWGEPAGWETP